WGQVSVAHDHFDGRGWEPQFLGDDLCKRRASALAYLYLAGERGYDAIFADVQPRADILRQRLTTLAAPPAAARFLSGRMAPYQKQDDESASHHLEEVSPFQVEVIPRRLSQLISLEFDLVDFRLVELDFPFFNG